MSMKICDTICPAHNDLDLKLNCARREEDVSLSDNPTRRSPHFCQESLQPTTHMANRTGFFEVGY